MKIGVPESDSLIISDTIHVAHKKGQHTHGIGRLPIYARKVREGLMATKTDLTIINESPVISLYDANNGFGQVAAFKGMMKCKEKAESLGIGIVAIKDINSFGVAGYYGELAAKNGMIGIVMGNASPALAPTGGVRAILGTNPICYAFPGTENNKHIVFDMACATVARSKIRLAAKNGEKIPLDWARDADGNPTDDPYKAIEGTLNSIGGYKGFGLAMMVDIFAGLLAGSAFAGDVKALNDPSMESRCGCFLMAINPDYFLGRDEYKARMDYLIDRIKSCGNPGEIFIPGEIKYKHEALHTEKVELSDTIINEINGNYISYFN